MRRLMLTGIENGEDKAYSYLYDIEKEGVRGLILGLGNGIWDELRVVGDTEDALNVIRKILYAGGYRLSDKPFVKNHLYQSGDECWQGFVFINPQPHTEEFQ